jgi:hypothetical protein
MSDNERCCLDSIFDEIEQRIDAILMVARRRALMTREELLNFEEPNEEVIPHSGMSERELRLILFALELAKRNL